MSSIVKLPLIVDMLRADGSKFCTNCRLSASRYRDNGNVAITATCTDKSVIIGLDGREEECEDGDQWSVITVNTGMALGDNYVCIKDYSEGAGQLLTMVAAGIVEEKPRGHVKTGCVEVPVCRLTPKGQDFVRQELAARGREKK